MGGLLNLSHRPMQIGLRHASCLLLSGEVGNQGDRAIFFILPRGSNYEHG